MGLDEATADAIDSPRESAPARKAMTMDKQDTGSEALVAGMAAEAMVAAVAAGARPADDSKKIADRRFTIVTDPARDALLTEFGKETLDDRYLLPGETYQDLFARVADAYDAEVANKLRSMISMVEPAVILIMGGVIGGIVISMMIPVLEITTGF